MKKYIIKGGYTQGEFDGYWLARVPYGSWRSFDTWDDAAKWLLERHKTRKRK